MLGIAAMFTSCSQSEDLLNEKNSAKQVTFSLIADSQVQTRATGDKLRYLIAIYDENGENEIVATREYDSNIFNINLDPGTYTCLFWADYGSLNYNIQSGLKNVTVAQNYTISTIPNPEAFQAKKTITVTGSGSEAITLTRAVAKVVLKTTNNMEAGDIKASYKGAYGFNVYTGEGIVNLNKTLTHTLKISNDITATSENPVVIGSFLTLANQNESNLTNITTQYANETEYVIYNVPLQANYETNLIGNFCRNTTKFTISCDENWITNTADHTTLVDANRKTN